MRRWWRTVAVVLVVSGVPNVAVACTCAVASKPAIVENAAVVFTGVVTSVSRPFSFVPSCTVSSTDPVVAVLNVETVYKGEAPANVTVRTVTSEASCGYAFVSGKRYTVFATVGANGLETNLCRGNVEGAIAPQEYGLGAPRPPKT